MRSVSIRTCGIRTGITDESGSVQGVGVDADGGREGMTKRSELKEPSSCFNKAHELELMFVLLERDPAMPDTIRDWVRRRISLGKNVKGDAQTLEALALAEVVEARQRHIKDYKGKI